MLSASINQDLLSEAMICVKDKQNPLNEIITEFIAIVKQRELESILLQNQFLFDCKG